MKVIVWEIISQKESPIIRIGETDGKLVDRDYVRVDGQLYHRGAVCQWSEEAEKAIKDGSKEYKRLTDERNGVAFSILNKVGHL